MTTSQEKGDALEAAVAAIEELILRTSPANFAKPIIERKKIVYAGGVHHEIDLYVTIDSASGYESVYAFECKNWQDAVTKDEIIVFAEKVDVANAARGFFVAKAFTSGAEAQAKKDPRLVLLLATEHDPVTAPYPVEFYGRFPQLTKVNMTIAVRGSKKLKVDTLRVEDTHTKYLGTEVSLLQTVDGWAKAACDKDVERFNSEPKSEGIYEFEMDWERFFSPGELIVNEKDIERMSLHIEYKIVIEQSRMISHFEIESRGRYFRFAPLTAGGATLEGHIVLSNLGEIRPKP